MTALSRALDRWVAACEQGMRVTPSTRAALIGTLLPVAAGVLLAFSTGAFQ